MKVFHYAVFALVLLGGLCGSGLLIPGQSDLGLMYFKDKQYAKARQIYEGRFARGERSVDVIMPLAEIYVQFGEIDRAVGLLKRFAGSSADTVEITERIGKFQRYAQRPDEYLQSLEEANRLKPSEGRLRELANLYRYTNQNSKLVPALQTLAVKYPGNPGDFLEIANLQAVEGRTAMAAGTLDQFESAHPEAVTADTVEFLISLLIDSAQGERALERSARWLKKNPDPNLAARLAGLLHFKGQPELGLKLLLPFDAAADRNPALLGQWIQLQVAAGNRDAAFGRLDRLHREGRLPNEITESMVDLAFQRNNLTLALEVAEKNGLRGLPDWLLANLAGAALDGNRAGAAYRMVVSLGEDFLQTRPLLAVRLALARGDRPGAVRWAALAARNPTPTDAERFALSGFAMTLGNRDEAFTQISRMKLRSQPAAVLEGVARSYITLGQSREGAARFDRLRAAQPGPGVDQAWSLLAASLGRGQEVEQWLKSLELRPVSEDLLRDLYFAANDHHQPELAVTSASRMYRQKDSDSNRLLLAQALTSAGRGEEAIPHLRQLLARSRTAAVEEAYTAALLGAIRTAPRPELKSELREFWTSKLRNPDQEERRRLDLIYGLLDLQAWDAVLPQLADLAHRRPELLTLYIETAIKALRKQDAVNFLKAELDRQNLPIEAQELRVHALIEQGGVAAALPYIQRLASTSMPAWIAAYEAALTSLGRPSDLVAFWTERAAKAEAPADEKRSIAFKLLESGRKDAAQAIFTELARNARPDQPDVSELMFLWGPKPGAEALNWLEARARRATGDERAAWLRRMMESGAPDRAAAIAVVSLPRAGEGGAILDVYLQALAGQRKTSEFNAAITREVRAVRDPARVKSLALAGRQAGETAAAEMAYSRVLELVPGDPEALHWLGMFTFGRAVYSASEGYLSNLLASSEGGYDDNFYYAEMLWRRADRTRARLYYGRTLQILKRLDSPPLETRIAGAQALFRCGYVEQSIQEFKGLLAANPGNPDLRADFVSLLLGSGRYREAEEELSAPGSRGDRLARLRAQLLAATGRRSEGLELLIDFSVSHPGDARALADLALMEQSAGRHRRAEALLSSAENLDPGNEDFDEASTVLDRDAGPQVRAETLSRGIQGVQTERIVRLGGEQALNDRLRVRFNLDQDWASAGSVQYSDGRVAAFKGVRTRGEAAIEREWENGTRLQGSLFESRSIPGAGAVLTKPDAHGNTAVQIEIHRPFWEFAEALAQDGVRDRLEVRRETAFGRNVSVRLGAALNRYGLEMFPAAAASVTGTGGITVQLAERPRLRLEYNFDAEYRISAKSAVDAGGRTFRPLPLASREVHAVSATISKRLVRNLGADATAGVAIDRLGGRAPFAGLNLNYEPREHLTAQLNVDRRLYVLDTAKTVMTIAVRLSWRF